MLNIKRIVVFLVVMLLVSAFIPSAIEDEVIPAQAVVSEERFVAHAGGEIDGYEGSNCLEALQSSVDKGYALIEVDFITTLDGKVVLNHDWQYMYNRVPLARLSLKDGVAVTHSEFMSYKIFNQFTPLDLSSLVEFLDDNPSVRIITDTKEGYYALKIIADNFPNHVSRFIPQIYAFEDYNDIYDLGFTNIIATVYRMPLEIKNSPSIIASKAKQHNYFAITIPDELLGDSEYIEQLNTNEIDYYVHTINSAKRAEELVAMGFKGIYTDYLVPNNNVEELWYSINERIRIMNEADLSLLQDYCVYKINDPVYISKGKAVRVSENGTSSIFLDDETGELYLPLHSMCIFFGATEYTWHPKDNSITYKYKDILYSVNATLNEYKKTENGKTEDINLLKGATIYRDMVYLPKDFFVNIFSGKVFLINDFIVVTQNEAVDEMAMEILEVVF